MVRFEIGKGQRILRPKIPTHIWAFLPTICRGLGKDVWKLLFERFLNFDFSVTRSRKLPTFILNLREGPFRTIIGEEMITPSGHDHELWSKCLKGQGTRNIKYQSRPIFLKLSTITHIDERNNFCIGSMSKKFHPSPPGAINFEKWQNLTKNDYKVLVKRQLL